MYPSQFYPMEQSILLKLFGFTKVKDNNKIFLLLSILYCYVKNNIPLSNELQYFYDQYKSILYSASVDQKSDEYCEMSRKCDAINLYLSLIKDYPVTTDKRINDILLDNMFLGDTLTYLLDLNTLVFNAKHISANRINSIKFEKYDNVKVLHNTVY